MSLRRTVFLLAVLVALVAGCKPDDVAAPVPAVAELPRPFRVGPFTAPLPKPGESDWLTEHPEKGQTFAQFETSKRQVPNAERRVIYLQPIGAFSGPRAVDLERLREFTATFFQLPVVVNESMPLDRFPTREHPDFGQQINTHDVLAALKTRLPSNAYCMLGVTMEDLYPSEKWNFVFGMASLSERAGVFSFARYSPPGEGKLTPSQQQTMTERAFKVLAHETGHMFGIKHCTAWHCGMNGTNNIRETDRAPLSFCPVCLRKLQSSIGFDVAERDEQLSTVLSKSDLDAAAAWYTDRRAWILAE